MMKKVKKILLLGLFSFTIVGCTENDPVEIIKNRIKERRSLSFNYYNDALLIQKDSEKYILRVSEVIEYGFKEDLTEIDGQKMILATPQLKLVYELKDLNDKGSSEGVYIGELFENSGVDKGSKVYIKTDKVFLEWSYKNTENGWLYYYPSKYKVSTISYNEY